MYLDLKKAIKSVIAEQIWRLAPQVMLCRIRHKKIDISPSTDADSKLPTIGILCDFMGLHESYVNAARSLRVPYKVIDLMSSDWLIKVKESGCELFFTWPNPYHLSWKTMFEERLLVMERYLKLNVYPRVDEIWPWESKRRMSYWFKAHNIKAPKTWVFYNYEEAVAFARKAPLPIVFKPDFGDCARGIKIVRTHGQAIHLAKKAFRMGFHLEGHHPSDRTWGCLIFQEFIQNAKEWRVVRIGDSVFCYLKGKIGDFHSGTKLVIYQSPPKELLEFAMSICREGEFDCMSIDILEDADGRFYALEIQSVFGVDPWVFSMAIDGTPGRYQLKANDNIHEIVFEKGVFCENECCNLRIRDGLLKYYGHDIGFWENPNEFDRYLRLARTTYRHLIPDGL